MKSKDPDAVTRDSIGDTAATIALGLRLSQLSIPRQELVRLCQTINYGCVQGLCVKDGEPVLSPAPAVLIDIKLDSAQLPRPEMTLADFILPAEICRLLERLDDLSTTTIECLEVRAGVPRRVVFRAALQKGTLKPSRLGAKEPSV